MTDIPENRLTDAIINSAIEVHKTLGPGLKEEVYEAALAVELGLRGIACRRQVPVAVTYKGVDIGDVAHPKRIDILVDDAVVIECKALATAKDPLFRAQCLTYLKMTGKRVGLELEFGAACCVTVYGFGVAFHRTSRLCDIANRFSGMSVILALRVSVTSSPLCLGAAGGIHFFIHMFIPFSLCVATYILMVSFLPCRCACGAQTRRS